MFELYYLNYANNNYYLIYFDILGVHAKLLPFFGIDDVVERCVMEACIKEIIEAYAEEHPDMNVDVDLVVKYILEED